jgi:hypothetical protein
MHEYAFAVVVLFFNHHILRDWADTTLTDEDIVGVIIPSCIQNFTRNVLWATLLQCRIDFHKRSGIALGEEKVVSVHSQAITFDALIAYLKQL